jgi:hypothetical protein
MIVNRYSYTKTEDYEIKGSKLIELTYLSDQLFSQEETSEILIVGERMGNEGVVQEVMKKNFQSILCTDIIDIEKGYALDKIINSDSRVKFQKQDFVSFSEDKKFDYILCINVLEHFGMNYYEYPGFEEVISGDDYIRWNHDLRAIKKMIALLKEGRNSKIIITVPIGQPINIGDINDSNKMPFCRRYEISRINYICEMVKSMKMNIENKYYYSPDFENWYDLDSRTMHANNYGHISPNSSNGIWAFTIKK